MRLYWKGELLSFNGSQSMSKVCDMAAKRQEEM